MEIKEAIKTLEKAGLMLTLETRLSHSKYNDNFDEKMETIKYIIRNQQSYNEKDNELIANTIKDFVESLPLEKFAETNPNYGSFLFDEIVLENDTTIILKGHCLKEHELTITELNELRQKINEYGEKVYADEHDLYIKDVSPYLVYYTIRFWWD